MGRQVSKVLAARRLRVEQAMQESENRKEELAKATMDRKQRELGKHCLIVICKHKGMFCKYVTICRA
jgi:hypothetical protein